MPRSMALRKKIRYDLTSVIRETELRKIRKKILKAFDPASVVRLSEILRLKRKKR